MQLIKYAELTLTPWKNGGGITRDMAGASVGSNHILAIEHGRRHM